MKAFDEVIAEALRSGTVNLLFEQGMYSLMDDLERIVSLLQAAGIPFEVIGGVAVNAHILGVGRSRSFVTRDVDLLVQRADLDEIVSVAQRAGYAGRKMMGGFMLIRSGQQPEEAVHLLFVGEKARSSHPLANPELQPETKDLPQFGVSVPVAPVRDLVQMKLNSLRPKDEAHLEILDQCGLITPLIEADLPDILKERLREVRKRYSPEEPEEEV